MKGVYDPPSLGSYGATGPLRSEAAARQASAAMREKGETTKMESRCLVSYEESFFTKRSQFLQKTIWSQLAANTNVAEIVLRKSVGFLYTKRTQFGGKAEG
jgi:hypothetical protein